jgi:uncharacterized protein YijF (DUF1287 family)
MGDVAAEKGMAADVIVRCFRGIGIDLQAQVHDDMKAHFNRYPQLWNAAGPDTHIDHRRVANLQRFFERKSQTVLASRNPADYLPGDIVIWELGNAEQHIGIIVPSPVGQAGDVWVVHNMGAGVKWENILSDYPVQHHFRLPLNTGN